MANNKNCKDNLHYGGMVGHKGGPGRPPDEFKSWCKKLLHSPKTKKFVEDLVMGEPTEEIVVSGKSGNPIRKLIVANPKIRLQAIEWLADRSEGKVPQAIGGIDDEGKNIPFSIVVNKSSSVEDNPTGR